MNEKAYDNLIMKIMHDESIFYSFMLNSAMRKGFSSLTMLLSGPEFPVNIYIFEWLLACIAGKTSKGALKMTFLGEHP